MMYYNFKINILSLLSMVKDGKFLSNFRRFSKKLLRNRKINRSKIVQFVINYHTINILS